jgi:hypothetical protein
MCDKKRHEPVPARVECYDHPEKSRDFADSKDAYTYQEALVFVLGYDAEVL